MMPRTLIAVFLFPIILFLLPITTALADDAEVLPRGISRASVKGNIYSSVDERFNDRRC